MTYRAGASFHSTTFIDDDHCRACTQLMKDLDGAAVMPTTAADGVHARVFGLPGDGLAKQNRAMMNSHERSAPRKHSTSLAAKSME
jgi:hypothetical protein